MEKHTARTVVCPCAQKSPSRNIYESDKSNMKKVFCFNKSPNIYRQKKNCLVEVNISSCKLDHRLQFNVTSGWDVWGLGAPAKLQEVLALYTHTHYSCSKGKHVLVKRTSQNQIKYPAETILILYESLANLTLSNINILDHFSQLEGF